MNATAALRDIVQAEDPLLASLPDAEPHLYLPVRRGARPTYQMICPSCGKVWQTTNRTLRNQYCFDTDAKTGKRIKGSGCGALLPPPAREEI